MIVAGQALPVELESVKSGHVQCPVGVNCFQMGYGAIEILLEKRLFNRTPSNAIIYSPLTHVKKSNVNEWDLNWKKWLIKEAVNK
jgi:hypothetical protein